MNNYIVLNGKKYKTLAADWTPVPIKPATSRYLLSGAVDVSYGPGVYREYRGVLLVPQAPAEGWGGRADLEAAFEQRRGLDFTDHEENVRVVHLFGELPRQSISPRWDSPSNEFRVPVRLVCA